jgi:hypothetical protein
MVIGRVLLAMVAIGLGASTAPAMAAVPLWTTYRHDAARSGVDPDSGTPVAPTQAWQTPALDGNIYGQPLLYGSTVFVATENDTVYALDVLTGAVVWQRHLATAVPSGQLPCGDISPVVGITSTPVIDLSTGAIYVVADTWDGTNVRHELFGLAIASGAPTVGPVGVDPPGSTPPAQLQRAALALDASKVIIGFGGNDGDCSTYHGWLVAVPETGGPLQTFEVDPQGNGGAVWGAGNGPAVDSAGDIWAASGNGSASSFGYQESVLKLDPNLKLLDFWAPSNWSSLDSSDTDLGSSAPVLLPGGLVFQIGKEGVGYLLSQTQLGGAAGGPGGAPLYEASVCSGSWGGGIYDNGVIYVACGDGLHALALNASSHTFMPLSGWTVNGSTIGPPTAAGGLVWSADYHSGTLYGLNPRTGATSFSANLGTFDHFASPSAAGGRLFVANGAQVTAFTIATSPTPSSTSTGLFSSQNPSAIGKPVTFTATVSPPPDAGSVGFTDNGTPITGCTAISASVVSGRAACTTTYGQAAIHKIVATYSGDAYYAGSSSPTLNQMVEALPGTGAAGLRPLLFHVRITLSHGRIRLRLTLSVAATIMVAVEKAAPGHVVDKRCRAGHRAAHRCRAWSTMRTLKLRGKRGKNSFLLRTTKLRRGRYRLSLIARDLAGRRSPRVIISFKVPAHPGQRPVVRPARIRGSLTVASRLPRMTA